MYSKHRGSWSWWTNNIGQLV